MQTFESRVCLVPEKSSHAHRFFSNKAVADGAVLSYIDPLVTSRTSRFTYGIECYTPYLASRAGHREREKTQFTDASGVVALPNAFQSILTKVCWLLVHDHTSFT